MKSRYHDNVHPTLLPRGNRRRRRQRPHGHLGLHKSLLVILHRHMPLEISPVSTLGHMPPNHRQHLLRLSSHISRIPILRIVCRGLSAGKPRSISATECREQTRHHARDQWTEGRETGADDADVAFDGGPGGCGDVVVFCRC